MAYRYRIDASTRTVIGEGEGVLTLKDVLTARDQLSQDPAFDSTFALLIDLTGVERLDLDGSQVQCIADGGPLSKSSPRAIVVCNTGSFGYARMYQAYSGFAGIELVAVFRDRAAALTWLRSVMPKPATQACDPTCTNSLPL